MAGAAARAVVEQHPPEDLIASFAIGHPGLLQLHNYPDTMRALPRSRADAGGGGPRTIDLGAIDVVRDRERGVPRYNDFRRMLRLPPAADFAALTGDAASARGAGRTSTPTSRTST